MSTSPHRAQSGLFTKQVTLAGTTQVFHKNTTMPGDQEVAGDATHEPASFRELKNTGTNSMYFGPAGVTTGTGRLLAAGEAYVLLGPSGEGYAGDVYVVGTDGDKVAVLSW